jgi:hypothetical protein
MLWLLKLVLKFSGFIETAWAQGGPIVPGGPTVPPAGGVSITLINPLECKLPGYEGFGCVAQAIINALFYISIPLVSIMVLIGGFQILTAAGNPEKFTKGRNTILYAVLGFAIIIIGLGAVSLIRQLLGA